jgi:hypothetical protein
MSDLYQTANFATLHCLECRFLKYPVDNALLKQNKCRTQALKLLLSMPPAPTNTTSRSWRLTYLIAEFLSYLQVKHS